MPSATLTDVELERAERLQENARSYGETNWHLLSQPTHASYLWRISGFTEQAAEIGVRACTTCHTPYPDDPRWFYVRPPQNTYTRCQLCYRAYQARYNVQVRRKARQLKLTSERNFGLELEFVGGTSKVRRAMIANGLQCCTPGYTHSVMSQWKIVPDGSVARGAELVSPILSGEMGAEDTILACKALKEGGASTDQSTGLHVHHTVRDLSCTEFKKVYAFWFNTQDALEALVAPSRRGTSWANKVSDRDLRRVSGMSSFDTRTALCNVDRYRNLNITSYPQYGTMEVRWHQGTRDPRKIIGWTALFQSILAYVQMGGALPVPGEELESVLERLQSRDVLEPKTVDWLKVRAKQLNPLTETEMQRRAAILVAERRRREEAYRSGERDYPPEYSEEYEEEEEEEGDVGEYRESCTCAACQRWRQEQEIRGEREEY